MTLDWSAAALSRLTAADPCLLVIDSTADEPIVVRNEVIRRVQRSELASTPVVICGNEVAQLRRRWAELLDRPNAGLLMRPFDARALVETADELQTAARLGLGSEGLA